MDITVYRAELLHACKLAELAINGRTPKPVLMCVKIVAANNLVSVSGTNLEQYVTASTAQVQIDSCGESAVAAEKIIAVLDQTPDETVGLVSSGDRLSIKNADAEMKLIEQKASDFPKEPKLLESVSRTLPARLLQAMFNQTRFAADRKGWGPKLGVMLRFDGDGLSATATDGRRIAKAVSDAVHDERAALSVVVPAKSIDSFLSAELEPEETVTVEATDNTIAFDSFKFRLVTTLLEGEFPKHDDLLGKEFQTKSTVGRLALHKALAQASMMTSNDPWNVVMQFSDKKIIIRSRSPECGEAEVQLACHTEGPELEIGFNPHYLKDGLEAVADDDVVIQMRGPAEPGMVSAKGFQYLLMPVSLS